MGPPVAPAVYTRLRSALPGPAAGLYAEARWVARPAWGTRRTEEEPCGCDMPCPLSCSPWPSPASPCTRRVAAAAALTAAVLTAAARTPEAHTAAIEVEPLRRLSRLGGRSPPLGRDVRRRALRVAPGLRAARKCRAAATSASGNGLRSRLLRRRRPLRRQRLLRARLRWTRLLRARRLPALLRLSPVLLVLPLLLPLLRVLSLLLLVLAGRLAVGRLGLRVERAVLRGHLREPGLFGERLRPCPGGAGATTTAPRPIRRCRPSGPPQAPPAASGSRSGPTTRRCTWTTSSVERPARRGS